MQKRAHLRYKPDSDAVAWLDFSATPGEFNPGLPALILEEGFGGAGLVVVSPPRPILAGLILCVKVGKLAPMRAEVRWSQTLDGDRIQKFGIKYLE